MGSENRDYYRDGGGGSGGDYLGNPVMLLSFSVPFGRWFGVPVRLHFWLLLTILFYYVDAIRGAGFLWTTIDVALLIAALMCHEFGHRFFAHAVGGSHEEFMLWPAGGMIHPQAPPAPWPMFVTHVGGIVTNIVLCLACLGGLAVLRHLPSFNLLNVLSVFSGTGEAPGPGISVPAVLLSSFFSANLGIILINLLPFYWFDGGYLLQSILWPWTGLYQSINVTCIVGMVVAVPFFILSLLSMSLLGMIFWVLLFSDSFMRRRSLQASGVGELEAAVAYSANDQGDRVRKRRGLWRWPSRDAVRAAAAERKEQEKVDAILAKVHAQGMHSLTWFERRTLQKATARQRRRTAGRR